MSKRTADRRITRTHASLRDALVSLIREKNYDGIAVKEILDRANVGRSTFYAHFRDKDDLLISGIHDMLHSAPAKAEDRLTSPADRLLRFSLPIFEYHDRHRHGGDDTMGTSGRATLHEHLRKVVAELLTDEFRRQRQPRSAVQASIPPNLLAQHIASTFLVVLNWWLESRSALGPQEVDALFRSLVVPILSSQ